jgi:hypothetical protein
VKGLNLMNRDFIINNNKLCKYTGKYSEIYIPETVRVIGEYAFAEMECIKETI